MLISSIFKLELEKLISSKIPKNNKITKIDPETGEITIVMESVNSMEVIRNSPYIQSLISSSIELIKYLKDNADITLTTLLTGMSPSGPVVITANQIVPKAIK